MTHTYSYEKSSTFSNGIKSGQLHAEIKASAITTQLHCVSTDNTKVYIVFASDLPEADIIILNSIITNHRPTTNDDRKMTVSGKLEYISNMSKPDAIKIYTSDSQGGIVIHSKSGGLLLDSTMGDIEIGNTAASIKLNNFTLHKYIEPILLNDSDHILSYNFLKTGILYGTPTTNRKLTLPNIEDIEISPSYSINFTVINIGNIVLGWTLIPGTGCVIIGNPIIGTQSSGLFKLCVNLNNYIVYRTA